MAAMDDQDLSRAPWRKSTYSGNGNNCVEVAAADGLVGVRDTSDRNGVTVILGSRSWQLLMARVKHGRP